MFKMGHSSIDYLLVVITFLPLTVVLLIFGRKLYLQEPMNFLLIICLLGFLREVLELTYPLSREDQFIINKVLALILLLLLVACFRANLNDRGRYILDILLSALLSLAITYWSVTGWEKTSPLIDILLNSFLGALILVSLPAIIRSGSLQVLRSSQFWIGGGTLFYILLYLLVEGTSSCCRPLTKPPDPDTHLFLHLANLVRYLFYLIAALATRPSPALPRVS